MSPSGQETIPEHDRVADDPTTGEEPRRDGHGLPTDGQLLWVAPDGEPRELDLARFDDSTRRTAEPTRAQTTGDTSDQLTRDQTEAHPDRENASPSGSPDNHGVSSGLTCPSCGCQEFVAVLVREHSKCGHTALDGFLQLTSGDLYACPKCGDTTDTAYPVVATVHCCTACGDVFGSLPTTS